MAVKVAFMQGSDCWGCHQSLLNAHLGLLGVLPALEIVYWPAVVDFKHNSLKARTDREIDVGFCEGSLRTNADVENIKLMRQKCKFIIAFGSCSCYGNVHGLANQWKKENLVKRKFSEVESIADESSGEPTVHVSGFTEKLVPTDEVIQVDASISGCPPRPEQIVSSIMFLLGQKQQPMGELAYCNECPINNNCLLDRGILCFGPITSTGCSLKCTTNDEPCVGCYGPAKTVSSKITALDNITDDLSSINSGDKKSLYEALALFLNIPLMAGFDLSADILKQIKINGEVLTPLTNLPPDTEKIASKIIAYLRNHPEFHDISTVCDTCPRIRGRIKMTKVKRDYQGLPNLDDCFIEQGYLCMGPVTNAGCGGLCMRVNAPCSGCYGQTEWVADQASRYAEIITKDFNVGLSKNELLTQVKDKLGIFEKFTLAMNKSFEGGE